MDKTVFVATVVVLCPWLTTLNKDTGDVAVDLYTPHWKIPATLISTLMRTEVR
jgi:hypothetical protein